MPFRGSILAECVQDDEEEALVYSTRTPKRGWLIPRTFEYLTPSSLSEAISLLSKYQGDAKVLAGGQSLIPLMKLRLASPPYLVDINNIHGLEYVREHDGGIGIGALTRMADIERSATLAKRYPILCEAASQIADPLVRNMGTIGGNVSHGDPANDMPAVMLALDSEFALAGPDGERIVKAREFFLDTFTTALAAAEVLREIRIPTPRPRSSGAYLKLEKQAGDFAIAGVAVQLSLGEDGTCDGVGIGLTAVGPTAIHAKNAEQKIIGKRPTKEVIQEVATTAKKESSPTGDLRGSAEYKREMVAVMTQRALELALKRARGK